MPTPSQRTIETTIRLLESGDRDDMILLFEKTFGHSMGATENERHWEWEYVGGSQGPALVFVCEAEGKVVGAHGNLPLRFKVGAQTVTASSSFDSMVDADYRGLGAFSGVVRAFKAAAYERGICLSYSFPNENSFPIHVKRMGRTSIEGYIVLRRSIRFKQLTSVRGLKLLAWVCKRLAQARLRGATIAPAEAFDARFDALWEAAKEQVPVGIVRDSRYLHWRFAQKPESRHTTYVYEEKGVLGGYIVLKMKEEERYAPGLVMDVLALPGREEIVHALFAKAFLHFVRARAGQVRFGTMAWGPYTKMVEPLFPYRVERWMCGEAYGGVDPAFALDGDNWFVSFADTDFY
jgi:hypothetical protein